MPHLCQGDARSFWRVIMFPTREDNTEQHTILSALSRGQIVRVVIVLSAGAFSPIINVMLARDPLIIKCVGKAADGPTSSQMCSLPACIDAAGPEFRRHASSSSMNTTVHALRELQGDGPRQCAAGTTPIHEDYPDETAHASSCGITSNETPHRCRAEARWSAHERSISVSTSIPIRLQGLGMRTGNEIDPHMRQQCLATGRRTTVENAANAA